MEVHVEPGRSIRSSDIKASDVSAKKSVTETKAPSVQDKESDDVLSSSDSETASSDAESATTFDVGAWILVPYESNSGKSTEASKRYYIGKITDLEEKRVNEHTL